MSTRSWVGSGLLLAGVAIATGIPHAPGFLSTATPPRRPENAHYAATRLPSSLADHSRLRLMQATTRMRHRPQDGAAALSVARLELTYAHQVARAVYDETVESPGWPPRADQDEYLRWQRRFMREDPEGALTRAADAARSALALPLDARERREARLILETVARQLGTSAVAVTSQQQAKQPVDRRALLQEMPRVGYRAPDFQLEDFGGTAYRLSDYHRRHLLLTFVCGCRRCHTVARTWQESFAANRDPQVLAVAAFSPSEAREFRRDTGLRHPLLFDPFGQVGKRYDSTACPRCWLIDAAGTIVYTNRDVGQDVRQMRDEIIRHVARGDRVAATETGSTR